MLVGACERHQVGKVDAKKRLETDVDDVMTNNILQALAPHCLTGVLTAVAGQSLLGVPGA